jgi:hypothetical protein
MSPSAMLKARVAGKFYHALDCNEPWAVQMAMRNQFGWDAGRGGFNVDPAALADDRKPPLGPTQIVFVVPSGNRREIEPPPHYDPAPPGQKLLPPPKPMFKNALGMWEELPEGRG